MLSLLKSSLLPHIAMKPLVPADVLFAGGSIRSGEEWEGTEVPASASLRAVGLPETEGDKAFVGYHHL